MLRLVVPVVIKTDKIEGFLKATKPLIESSRAEAGCIEYFLLQTEVPNLFYFVELWESKEILARHSASEHFKKFVEESSEFLLEKINAEIYEKQ